jgi:hypothetical protein
MGVDVLGVGGTEVSMACAKGQGIDGETNVRPTICFPDRPKGIYRFEHDAAQDISEDHNRSGVLGGMRLRGQEGRRR